MAQQAGDSTHSDLAARIVSAGVLAPGVLVAVYFGTPFFEFVVGLMALILAWEWNRLCGGRILWLLGGLFYIIVPCGALIYLRSDTAAGMETLLWLLAVVWATDTAAYGAGRLIGGAKLSPVISPNKTWSGLLGGLGAAGIVGALTAVILAKDGVMILAMWSAAIGLISQAGDLAESWVKRHFRVKDTSAIIPGHGGLFDRVDGLLAAAVAVAMIGAVNKGGILTWS
ncbi:MAG: phosphatidate cytidylyltransferase [Proteobacteria bacterium]|nr:phosphatidate cytidylyltransferase [Pseudomonadota bacterium]